jgi:hypothetical protein
VNSSNSIKWNSVSGNSSIAFKQQKSTRTVSVQRGVHGVPKTGKCSRTQAEMKISKNTQGICETIAGNS